MSVSFAAALLAPNALAAPAGQVRSVSVDPATVVHAGEVRATVEVTNRGERRSKALNLLLKLRAPDGNSGLMLTSRRVGRLAPRASRTVELTPAIPADAPSGDSTLVACRAKKGSGNACGVSRQTTPLRVLTAAQLTISPSPHGFGTHATGSDSPAQTFTVTNTGESPSGALATSLAGAEPAQFTKSADSCAGQTLAGGASCTLDGAFAPTSAGAKSAGLDATATPGGTATATLNGTGATPADLQITPNPHGFGTHATATTSAAQTFTVTNTGGVPSGTIATSLAGTDPGQFTKSADNCNGQTLGPGQNCTVNAAFAPSATGAKAASLDASATPGGTASAALSGTGATPADLEITPSPHAFGNRVNNTTSPAQTFTVTNTGGVPSGTIATSLAGTDSGQFTKSADNCNGQTLAAGANCTVNAAFAPTSSGSKSASLQAVATPGGTASASLSGTGQTPANLTISPSPYNYGNVLQGTTASKEFTITNTGEQAAVFDSFQISGPNFAQFSFGADDCPVTLTGGASCHLTVNWGAVTGAASATLTVSGFPGGSPTSGLTGNAVTTPVNLTMPLGDISGNNNLGAPGAQSVPVVVTNTGAADAQNMTYDTVLTGVVGDVQMNAIGFDPFDPDGPGGPDPAYPPCGQGLTLDGGASCSFIIGVRSTTGGTAWVLTATATTATDPGSSVSMTWTDTP